MHTRNCLSLSVSVARSCIPVYIALEGKSARERERERERETQPYSLSFFLFLSLPSFPRHVETCSVTGFSVGTGLLLRGIHVSPLPLRTWLAYVQAGTEAGGGRGMILRVERERERDRDRRLFFSPPDTGSFSIACTVNDHFAPSFRVIQRGVEIVERSSFPLPPPRSSWIFVYRDDWFPFSPPLSRFFSRVSRGFLRECWNIIIPRFLSQILSHSFESKRRIE